MAWIAERKDVLSGLCFVSTLWAYVWYVRGSFSWRRYLLVVVALAFGLMAKPMLVTTPFVLLLLDYWPLGRFAGGRFSRVGRLVMEKIPLLLLAALSCVATVFVQSEASALDKEMPLLWRAANAMLSYVTYAGQLFYPLGLAAYYPHPASRVPLAEALAAGLALVCITAVAVAYGRRRPYLLVGWLWYVGMLVPVIGLVQIGSQARADRYTYLPQIGLCLAVVFAAADVCRAGPGRRAMGAFGSALVLMLLMGCAWRQTSFWSDSETLWNHALACTSDNAVAHYNLGNILGRRRHLDEAIAHYRQAIGIRPDLAEAHASLGVALFSVGRLDEAMAQDRKALEIRPRFAVAHYNLGIVLAARRQFDAAMEQYRAALDIRPDDAAARYGLGLALLASERVDEAIEQLQQTVETKPDFPEAHHSLGAALVKRGRSDEAIVEYRKALELRPNFALVRYRLGRTLVARGQFQEAIAQFEGTLKLRPDDVEILAVLAAAYADVGRFPEAAATARQALDLATRHNNQALADILRARLALYAAGKPSHEKPGALPPARLKP